jgi:hypothetical protein
MDNKVAAFAATPDPTFGQKPAPQQRPDTGSAAKSAAPGPDQVLQLREALDYEAGNVVRTKA